MRHKTLSSKALRQDKSPAKRLSNGFVHVAVPASAAQICKALGIGSAQTRNVLRAFAAAGVTGVKV
ncbi:MAG: hypothetical protein WCO56_27775 [Verrucomicrobiota bacterium]